MNLDNLSPVEFLCICVTISGVAGCGRLLYYAIADQTALRRAHERGDVLGTDYEAKRMLARANVRSARVGGALFTAALVLSCVWAWTPPPIRASLSLASFATSAFILSVAIIAALTVWLNGIERAKLYEMARKAEGERIARVLATGRAEA